MTTRYDAIAVRKYQDRDGNDKSSFTNIGVAWPMKDRDGFRVQLHAIPAPVDGEFTILLMPPRPRDDGGRAPARKPASSAPAPSFGDDDSIPFAPEWRG